MKCIKNVKFKSSEEIFQLCDEEARASINELATSKQDKLISGTNIKTINSQSILGSGNISIQGGSGSTTLTACVFDDSATIPSSLSFDVNTPVLYYTAGTNSSLTFNSFTSSTAIENGVYTWELICSSNNAITSTTFASSIQYVGNDRAYNPDLSFSLIDNARTAHVFSVRLIKNDTSTSWMFAYNYSFKG